MRVKLKFWCWVCAGMLASPFSASITLAQDILTGENVVPVCTSTSVDSDGDGWGWENERSCRVAASQSQFPACSSSQVDSDSDGWGWENSQSCVVTDYKNTAELPACSSARVDSDGDGFGWENERSCVVASAQSELPECTSSDLDPDGDGWGWENNGSCVVVATKKPDVGIDNPDSALPICRGASVDADGDGYGWENQRSCVVASAQTELLECTSPDLDPDGDGWGWENNSSCVVIAPKIPDVGTDTPESELPTCISASVDTDGDGYGWENERSCLVAGAPTEILECSGSVVDFDGDGFGVENGNTCFVINPKLGDDVQVVVTPDANNPFSKFQLANTLYTNNVYDRRQVDANNNGNLISYNGVQDFVRWEVPAFIGTNPSPCVRTQTTDPVTLSYRLTSRKDSPTERNTFVRAYPAMVVGTMGGRYESWGVECGATRSLQTDALRHGRSPVFQMETVAAATGMPVLAADLDFDVRVSVKADLLAGNAANGVANVFLDSYWHDVSEPSQVPSNDLVDTINGINSNFTEVWNLNIWFDYPRFEGSASSWTGGFKIGSVYFNQGGLFDVYFKIEGARNGHRPLCVIGESDNCFLYVALVDVDANAARKGTTINYTEVASWMRSAAFRDLFLIGAGETDTNAARAHEAWRLIDGTDNDNSPDPARRGPRFPDQDHVIGGIHLGAELWYNPNAVPASIVFETLGVEVEGKGQFGRYVEH